MLKTDDDWRLFLSDMKNAIKKAGPSHRRTLKDIQKSVKKKGYATINQFLIACEILDDIDTKKEMGDNSEND